MIQTQQEETDLSPLVVHEKAAEAKTYYSRSGSLVITINHGVQRIGGDGRSATFGHKLAEFSRQPDGYGRLVTDDIEIIRALDKRMETIKDVFDGGEYNRRTMSNDVKLKMAQEDQQRTLTENNRLMERLESVERELAAERAAKKAATEQKVDQKQK